MKELKQIARRLARMVPGVIWFKRYVFDRIFHRVVVPVEYPHSRGPVPRADFARLREAYEASPLAGTPDTFVLYRIIGNDLYPRHRKGQSRDNLRFILENEPEFAHCEKRFVVNRIVDADEERQIIEMLERACRPYLHIPFDRDEYSRIGWDAEGIPVQYSPVGDFFARLAEPYQDRAVTRLYRHKNNYVMNNNGARNAALRDGRGRAKWVLPWDGNCFITAQAWEEVLEGVKAHPEAPYHIVPMARINDNAELLQPDFRPPALEEPQVLFRQDAALEFDEQHPYGRRPKVELLWRLGVPGGWDSWPIEPWDLPFPQYAADAGKWVTSGWVVRLASGRPDLEKGETSLNDRGIARVEAITSMLDRLDESILEEKLDPQATVFVRNDFAERTDPALLEALRLAAEEALGRGPYSVIHKTTLPPSGNPHDYWHPAPYYWPNPLGIPGLPYIRRDGRRAPGTRMYEPLSEQYDRTRLQRLFDDTWVLALAFQSTRDARFAEHAAKLVRTWFLDEATRMTPHLIYAQVRIGWDRNKGLGAGIIEMKDLYYFLDAVRLLQANEALNNAEIESLRQWFREYLEWLLKDEQGRRERTRRNNHGTYYDLQVAAIAAWLGEVIVLRNALRDARLRVSQQFEPDGRQPEEMKRTITAHYCCFNLQGWVHLAELADRTLGVDLWSGDSEGRSLRKAVEWTLQYRGKEWPFPQVEPFDAERFVPLQHAYERRFGVHAGIDFEQVKPVFHPHDGIRPFWQL